MPVRINDRWLWLGFGALLYCASKGIAYGLHHMVELNTIDDDSVDDPQITTDPEDSIALSALSKLVQSPNNEVSKAATDLLLARFLRSHKNRQAWLDDLFSDSVSARRSAGQLRRLYELSPGVCESGLLDINSWRGLMDLSARSTAPEARTIRAAYAVAREFLTRDIEAPMLLLRQLSLTMDARRSTLVFLCPDMNKAQFLPWISAMRADAFVNRGSPADKTRATMAMEKFLADVAKAGQASAKDIDDESWLADAVALLSQSCALRLPQDYADTIKDTGPIDPDTDWVLHDWNARSRVAFEAQSRFREESLEEAEVRRRNRQAVVMSVPNTDHTTLEQRRRMGLPF